MEQRQPRLGDILDDYCPRERRITNHAVVAMLGEKIQQTRCVTCDDEHSYKAAKAPTLRRRKVVGAGSKAAGETAGRSGNGEAPSLVAGQTADRGKATGAEEPPPESAEPVPETAASDAEPAADAEGPVHRPLIRATLPRPERTLQPRQLPEFTVRQPGGWNGGSWDQDHRGQSPGRAGGGRPAGAGGGKRPPRGRSMHGRSNASGWPNSSGDQPGTRPPSRQQRPPRTRRDQSGHPGKKRSR